MDVKIAINISTRSFDECNDVAMKMADGTGMADDGGCNEDAMIIYSIHKIITPNFTP